MAMVYCLEHCDSANEISSVISQNLLSKDSSIPKKVLILIIGFIIIFNK